jgi:hypothetical protein
MMHEVPCITALTGAAAAVSAIRALREEGVSGRCRNCHLSRFRDRSFCAVVASVR